MTGIHVIDLNFQGLQEAIAVFLIKSKKGHILIETGPSSTLPALKKGLAKHKVRPEEIKHVFLTHVHLDHAGAAWYFAELGATVYAHPKGLAHLKKPEKLWASAKRIYKSEMEKLWGDMRPIPAKKLVAVRHKKRVTAGAFKVRALHTPGHAVHHAAWEIEDVLFSGDVGGVRIANGPVVPPCPPPDINIEDWKKSIRLIQTRRYKRLFLTHFGEVKQVKLHLVELNGRLSNWVTWLRPFYESGVSQEEVLPQFVKYVDKQLAAVGVSKKARKKYELANPSWMSVAGLYRYYKKFS